MPATLEQAGANGDAAFRLYFAIHQHSGALVDRASHRFRFEFYFGC